MTQCELCFLSKSSMSMLRKQYPELDGRMMRFQRAGTKMTHQQRGRLNRHLDGLQKSLTAAGKGGKLADLFKKQQEKETKAGTRHSQAQNALSRPAFSFVRARVLI